MTISRLHGLRMVFFVASLITAPTLLADSAKPSTIKISRAAPYAGASASAKIKAECDWNAVMMENIVKYGKGKIEMTDESLDSISGKTLKVVITRAEAMGGGPWTPPKSGAVMVALRDNGTVINEYELTKQTGGGMTACDALRKVAVALGANIAKRAITFKPSAPLEKS